MSHVVRLNVDPLSLSKNKTVNVVVGYHKQYNDHLGITQFKLIIKSFDELDIRL